MPTSFKTVEIMNLIAHDNSYYKDMGIEISTYIK